MSESDLTIAVSKLEIINDNRQYLHFTSTLLSELILTIFHPLEIQLREYPLITYYLCIKCIQVLL